MSAVAPSFAPIEATRYNRKAEAAATWSKDPVAPDAINRKVELGRHGFGRTPSSDQIEEVSRAFYAIPEFRPLPASAKQIFAASKEWEGVVQSVGISHFFSELREVGSKAIDGVDLAEIPIGDVPAKDRSLLREGAIFRYLVGYAKTNKGTVSRKRHVYFRRGKANFPCQDEANWLETAAMFRE